MTVLETPRLTLRPLTGDDFDAFAAMLADPEVSRFLGGGEHGVPPDDAWRQLAAMIGHREIRGYSMWAVVERDTGAFAGRAGPWRPHGWPGLEVGWALAREHWGKGYATEAARAAVEFCFTALAADEVISLIAPGNERSAAVAERIGHRHLRNARVRDTDVQVYGQHRTH